MKRPSLFIAKCLDRCFERFWEIRRWAETDWRNFCGVCFRENIALELHHMGYYYGFFTSPSPSLVPVCRACHKKVELIKISPKSDSFDIVDELIVESIFQLAESYGGIKTLYESCGDSQVDKAIKKEIHNHLSPEWWYTPERPLTEGEYYSACEAIRRQAIQTLTLENFGNREVFYCEPCHD